MENRRVRMTKRMIKDAMVELTQTKALERITVKDICELADVNRSTFYGHFEDVYALLAEMEHDFISRIPADYSSDKTAVSDLEAFVRYIDSDRQLYVALRKCDPAFESRLTKTVWSSYKTAIGLSKDIQSDIRETDILYIIAGSCRVLDEWVKREGGETAEYMAAMLMKLALRVIGDHPKFCVNLQKGVE